MISSCLPEEEVGSVPAYMRKRYDQFLLTWGRGRICSCLPKEEVWSVPAYLRKRYDLFLLTWGRDMICSCWMGVLTPPPPPGCPPWPPPACSSHCPAGAAAYSPLWQENMFISSFTTYKKNMTTCHSSTTFMWMWKSYPLGSHTMNISKGMESLGSPSKARPLWLWEKL